MIHVSLLTFLLFIFEIAVQLKHFSFPFSISKPCHIPLPTFLQIHDPFIITVCKYAFTLTHFPKYNLLNPYYVYFQGWSFTTGEPVGVLSRENRLSLVTLEAVPAVSPTGPHTIEQG